MLDLRALAVTLLAEKCSEETARARKAPPADDRFCFELFRRAIVDRDQAAWAALVAQYSRLVYHWIGAQSPSVEDLANEVFLHVWQRVTPDYFLTRIPTLGAMLAYIHTCAHNAAINEARKKARREVALADDIAVTPSPEQEIVYRLSSEELMQRFSSCCQDEQERIVLHLSYVLGMSPREICAERSDLFRSPGEVSRTKEKLLDRLRRRLGVEDPQTDAGKMP